MSLHTHIYSSSWERSGKSCKQSKFTFNQINITITRFTIILLSLLFVVVFSRVGIYICNLVFFHVLQSFSLFFSAYLLSWYYLCKWNNKTFTFYKHLPPRNTKKTFIIRFRERLEVHQTRLQMLVLYLTPRVNTFHTWISDASERSSAHTRAWESLQYTRVEDLIRPTPRCLLDICLSSKMAHSSHSLCVCTCVFVSVLCTLTFLCFTFYNIHVLLE